VNLAGSSDATLPSAASFVRTFFDVVRQLNLGVGIGV